MDRQSASSKLEQENERLDREQQEGYKRYQEQGKREAEENAAPRKAIGEAFDYLKSKASGIKKSLGLKSGGKVSSASSRADGIAQRGKTKGRIV